MISYLDSLLNNAAQLKAVQRSILTVGNMIHAEVLKQPVTEMYSHRLTKVMTFKTEQSWWFYSPWSPHCILIQMRSICDANTFHIGLFLFLLSSSLSLKHKHSRTLYTATTWKIYRKFSGSVTIHALSTFHNASGNTTTSYQKVSNSQSTERPHQILGLSSFKTSHWPHSQETRKPHIEEEKQKPPFQTSSP